jgi:hypothetical protein
MEQVAPDTLCTPNVERFLPIFCSFSRRPMRRPSPPWQSFWNEPTDEIRLGLLMDGRGQCLMCKDAGFFGAHRPMDLSPLPDSYHHDAVAEGYHQFLASVLDRVPFLSA